MNEMMKDNARQRRSTTLRGKRSETTSNQAFMRRELDQEGASHLGGFGGGGRGLGAKLPGGAGTARAV